MANFCNWRLTKGSAVALGLLVSLTIFLTFLTTRPPISCFSGKYHLEMKCFFGWITTEMFTDAESQLILFRLKQRNCKLYNCCQQKSSRRFCETLNIDELNCGFYRQNHAFFFSNIFFNFSQIKFFQRQTASTDRILWVKMLKIINWTILFKTTVVVAQ